MVDKEFEKTARKFEKRLKPNDKKYVLMTHAPPYGTKLDALLDGHCGNKSIRGFIQRTKPDYAFSGHIHENEGKRDRLGKTRLINPGPFGMVVSV
jgi:Icc-related predicted phosphoesterase